MQAIQTKYIPATSTKPSRIKAWCDRGSLTISYPHEAPGGAEGAHTAAARQFVERLIAENLAGWKIADERYPMDKRRNYTRSDSPWSSPMICGGLTSGGFCFVFVPRGYVDALGLLARWSDWSVKCSKGEPVKDTHVTLEVDSRKLTTDNPELFTQP